MDPLPSKVTVGKDVYIDPTAYVGGLVTLGDQCTVMCHATIRGDLAHIKIGRRVNVQDGAILHTDIGVPLDIEDDVGIGHRAVIHCSRIGAGSLIGIGAIVLDGCRIGRRCIVAAGAVVPPDTVIPDDRVVMGLPAKIARETSETDHSYMRKVIQNYIRLGRLHAAATYANAAAT